MKNACLDENYNKIVLGNNYAIILAMALHLMAIHTYYTCMYVWIELCMCRGIYECISIK